MTNALTIGKIAAMKIKSRLARCARRFAAHTPSWQCYLRWRFLCLWNDQNIWTRCSSSVSGKAFCND